MRKHAPKNSKGRRGLLVQLSEGRAGQLLEVVCQLQRRRRIDGHLGGKTSPSKKLCYSYTIIRWSEARRCEEMATEGGTNSTWGAVKVLVESLEFTMQI